MMRRYIRQSLRQLHLWLGLSLGFLFVIVGLTGSALVFYVEADRAMNPQIARSAPVTSPQASSAWDLALWDKALATGRASYPHADGRWSFEVTQPGEPIPARYYPPSETMGHHAGREMIWFSADGSTIIRAEHWGSYMMSWIYELHMHLLAGETGRQIVGWSGLAICILLLSGLAVWWPKGTWRKALALKRSAASLRRLRDIHKLTGLWGLALLLILCGTGFLLALPTVKEALFPEAVLPAPRSVASHGQQISVARALAVAHAALPDARLAFIDVPGQGDAPFRIRVRVEGDPHQRFPSSYIFVDQHNARLLAVHDIRQKSRSSFINSFIRPLHDGSIAGLTGRIIAVIAGLLPLVLFVTGLLHWRRRMRARGRIDSTGIIS